ncbi:triphosphoribosyl-dephospho-CoA synthase, partial [Halorubrum sp. GN11GM_10-3_MGM]
MAGRAAPPGRQRSGPGAGGAAVTRDEPPAGNATTPAAGDAPTDPVDDATP